MFKLSALPKRWVSVTAPHRPRAKHRLHQMPRRLGHAPCAAARAEAALLARKRHQPFRVALLAHHAQEAVVEHAAAQKRLEFLVRILCLTSCNSRVTVRA